MSDDRYNPDGVAHDGNGTFRVRGYSGLMRVMWGSNKRPTRDQYLECLDDDQSPDPEVDPREVDRYYHPPLYEAVEENHLVRVSAPVEDRLWHTADGAVMRVGDMTDRHISNAMRMLERRGNTDSAGYRVLCEERQRRDALCGAAEGGEK